MKKHWLAVLENQSLTVARAAVGKNQEMIISFLADYKLSENEDMDLTGVKAWLQSHKIPAPKLKLAITSYGLITRVITLPQMSKDDLEKIITNHIDQYFTLNIQNYLIDYRILRKYKEDEKAMMNILLAAYPRQRMENIWNFCKDLGFEPPVIDLTADCLARIYSRLITKGHTVDLENDKSRSGDIAIISLNADQVEFVLLEKGLFFLYSDMEFDTLALEEQYYQQYQVRANRVAEETPNTSEREPVGDPVGHPADWGLTNSGSAEEKLTLYLSSYLEDEVDLVAAHDDFDSTLVVADPDGLKVGPEEESEDVESDEEIHIESDKESEELHKGSEELHKESSVEEQSDVKELDVEKPEFEELPVDDQPWQQAALSIPTQKNSDFVLEDLFVPLENLDEGLTITVTHQELEKESWPDQQPQLRLVSEMLNQQIGMGEAEGYLPEDGLWEELESNLTPVLSVLSELLSFFAARHFGHNVKTIYLTGEYCTLPYLAEVFAESFGIKTVVGFPRYWKPRLEGNGKGLSHSWQKYGSLYGLALRED